MSISFAGNTNIVEKILKGTKDQYIDSRDGKGKLYINNEV